MYDSFDVLSFYNSSYDNFNARNGMTSHVIDTVITNSSSYGSGRYDCEFNTDYFQSAYR